MSDKDRSSARSGAGRDPRALRGNTVKMRAIEPVRYGDHGEVAQPGETFETTPASAKQLEDMGHAERVAD
jgi:hypothetical protein